MKKQCFSFLLILLLITGCSIPMNMNNVSKEANFSGSIDTVNPRSILVKVSESEEAFKSSDLINVSLDVQLKDSMIDFKVGEEVRVYYDGDIVESYPAQVNTVYAILPIDQSE